MSDQDKPSPPSRDSSSASASQSPDALDSASVRELSAALHGLRQSVDDSRSQSATAERKGQFREQMMINAIEKNTAANKALAGSVANALKLNRAVVQDSQQTFAKAAEDLTGEIKTQSAELLRQGSMKEQAKALHFWLLMASIVLGVVGESGVITETHWQKLCVGLAMALGGLAVKYAAAWQSAEAKAQLGDGGAK